ncbi:hypothetical protein A1D18_05805 [Candidatus Rickettsiella isopodorum]|jgi:uncharacterized lipoprotein|uniref:Uncharacterized protein n=1 Tax=Candidatus Rickettsiella isopodorum TaxID=1225476 RepID=A0A1J8NGA3_9COXI|nr:hypothetical protein [Pseudomonadota bacterium]OIZ94353.1 hypothetical protein A1D18_05805 [Candidatus Rickettsiella isopodorum]
MRTKLFYLILIFFIVNLAACSSVNRYIKTQRSQYLYSQELPLLKTPAGLQIPREERYIIPHASRRPTKLPDLLPPTN